MGRCLGGASTGAALLASMPAFADTNAERCRTINAPVVFREIRSAFAKNELH